jgi:hypothetical protein
MLQATTTQDSSFLIHNSHYPLHSTLHRLSSEQIGVTYTKMKHATNTDAVSFSLSIYVARLSIHRQTRGLHIPRKSCPASVVARIVRMTAGFHVQTRQLRRRTSRQFKSNRRYVLNEISNFCNLILPCRHSLSIQRQSGLKGWPYIQL